jgi:hypothetical protein
MRLVIVLAGIVTMWLHPTLACSGPELAGKVKKLSEVTTAAFAKDPSGDETRRARVQAIIDRYRPLKHSTNGPAIIDATCREYDELISVYQ